MSSKAAVKHTHHTKHMRKKQKLPLARKQPFTKRTAAIFVLVFAAIGTAVVLLTSAATEKGFIELESNTVSGTATIISDANASGGKAIQFNEPAAPVQPPANPGTGPISLHPLNKRYFLYKNTPTILISSAEHYGAVINLDFDYTTYLLELKAKGLNYTRIFTGSYVEGPGANIFSLDYNNTLAPTPNKFITPWKRSSVAGYKNGGNKFDLNQWDEAYFIRLKDFVKKAEDAGVIVELTLFSTMYSEGHWALSPMNTQNNINSTPNLNSIQPHTLNNGSLLAFQEAYVAKIVTEMNSYNNIIYEIINEPYISNGAAENWQAKISSKIASVEATLPKKHLIAQNMANYGSDVKNPDFNVSIFNFHYADPPATIPNNSKWGRAIVDDETGFGSNDHSDRRYRIEAWNFITNGGSGFNHLDYSFSPTSEIGLYKYPSNTQGGGSATLRSQLRILQQFMQSFDFVKTTPSSAFVKAARGSGRVGGAFYEEGQQYGIWVKDGSQVTLDLQLPKGTYKAEWVDTKNGIVTKTESLSATGSSIVTVTSPNYTDGDTALRIKKM